MTLFENMSIIPDDLLMEYRMLHDKVSDLIESGIINRANMNPGPDYPAEAQKPYDSLLRTMLKIVELDPEESTP